MQKLETPPVEVYEVVPGSGRKTDVPLDLLDPTGPLPGIGDLLLVNEPNGSGILMAGAASAFRVVEREYLYFRRSSEEGPIPFVKVALHVRRLTLDEYLATPGG